MMKTLIPGFCLFVFAVLPASGQDAERFTISGQVRHRAEFDARDLNADSDNIWYNLLRTRLGLGVAVAPDLSVFIQAQDARVFGSEDATRGRGTLDGRAPALDLHQAYFRIQDFLDTPLTLKVGRQEMAYGNQRLIGSVGWSNIGRSFDAGILSFQTENAMLDVFASRLVGSTSQPSGQNLYGLYGTVLPALSHAIDGFLFVDNNTEKLIGGPDNGTSMLTRFTTGTYVHGQYSGIEYGIELVYQGGQQARSDTTRLQDIKAYLLSGALGYTISSVYGAHIGIQYSVLSGDKSLSDNESNTFNTLFATNHKFYGFMDFFPSTLPQQGLKDLSGSIALAPGDQLGLRLEVHHFMQAQEIPGTGENTYGQEVDFTVNYRYSDRFSIQSGLSAFFPDEVMKRVKGGDTALWFYLMSTVNF